MTGRDVFFLIFLFGFYQSSNGQNSIKTWVGGQHAQINFSTDSTYEWSNSASILVSATSAIICDSNGALLFYSNGWSVFNKEYNIMQNGSGLALGDFSDFLYGFVTMPDAAMILPMPGSNTKYYLFHMDFNNINTPIGVCLFPNHVFYSIIDMTLDNGLGGIISGEKNIAIIDDTLTQFGMQGIKHANGRDYWLFFHEYGTNRYYSFLIDPYGIHGPYSQWTGEIFHQIGAFQTSAMRFSNDGKKFLQLSWDSNKVELYDFDRCTGLFSNYQQFQLSDSNRWASGASFSPNSRYIYVSSNYYGIGEILQFDLQNPDIFSSRTIVGVDDGVNDPFKNRFFSQQLGFDGRIYIIAYDGNSSINIINEPDSAGLNCNFLLRGLDWNNGSFWDGVPNITNYNLQAIIGSYCDTINSVSVSPTKSVSIELKPNPCNNQTRLLITGVTSTISIQIFNSLGVAVTPKQQLLPTNQQVNTLVNMAFLPSGVYYLKVGTFAEEVAIKILKE